MIADAAYIPTRPAPAGRVFNTGEGEDQTFWTVVDFDHQAHEE